MNNENIEEILKNIGEEEIPANVHKIAQETSNNFINSLMQKQPERIILLGQIMKSRITKLAAVVMIVIGLGIVLYVIEKITTPVWAIEQTVEAIEGFHAIYGSGITVDENGNEFEYKFWARPRQDGTASGDFRMVRKGGKVTVVNEQQNVTYTFDPSRNVVHVDSGIGLYCRPWINGDFFRKMKEGCTEWHEEYRKDEITGRDYVFVKASDRDPGNIYSYIFQFDLETKLPIRVKVWSNSDFKGEPYVTTNKIVFNPVLPEGIFDFKIPEGTEVIKH